MENVPQIVRDRLRATTPAVNHPDADVLTAFTERSLPDLERAMVIEHLTRCTDCRDIVALALPESEAAAAVSPAHRGWLTWPALRWGLAAAGIVVVASVGILLYQRAWRPSMMVAKESRTENIAAYVPPSAPPSAVPVSTSDADKKPAASKSPAPAPPARVKLLEPKLVDGAIPSAGHRPQNQDALSRSLGGPVNYGPKAPTQWPQQNAQNQAQNFAAAGAEASAGTQQLNNSYAIKVPSAPQTVEVTEAAPPMDASQAETQSLRQLPSSNRPSGQRFDVAPGPVKAKPVVNALHDSAFERVIPRWSINFAGGLQRSFDQGNTWQNVDVSANPVLLGGASMSVALAKSAPTATPTEEKDAYKKAPAPAAASPVFRAVVAIGAEVWAGGRNGVLYHSVDAGNHWTCVVPSVSGAVLTSDVVSLEFSDARQGKIMTSTGETWTTEDGGQTWQKQ